MGVTVQHPFLPSFAFFLLFSVASLSFSQPNFPQNFTPTSQIGQSIPSSPSPSSSSRVVVVAVAASVGAALVISAVLFFFLLYRRWRRARARGWQRKKIDSSFRREEVDGALKGIVVDKNGLDVLYWRKYDGQIGRGFCKVMFNPNYEEDVEDKRIDREEKPRRGLFCFMIHHSKSIPEKKSKEVIQIPNPQPPAARSPPPPPPAPPPPSPPPSPPPTPPKKVPAPPPPPPIPAKKNPAPPPPPPQKGALASSLKPPPAPRRKARSNSGVEAPIEESIKEADASPTKLKPLHWDKLMLITPWSGMRSMMDLSDFMMVTLFGYSANNQKASETGSSPSSARSSKPGTPSQTLILEPRKSQNTAIVLKSLAVSRKEILDALLDGRGLDTDTLEKLNKIAPNQEEESKIQQFNGNPKKLADAESFLHRILNAVPSAFTRLNAMLFRSNYDPEILHLKESLQTLELACKELRSRGLFLKLLEAILKAGNRMNAGTARGNAQAFSLTALRKVSDVKSTDGKTTLLHFVVEQVVRSEGKRCVINRDHSLGKGKGKKIVSIKYNCRRRKREREYTMLGLPVLEGLSSEFSNVKKAATVDYDTFINMCTTLKARVSEICHLVTLCGSGERGSFVQEMKGFLEESDEELKAVKGEHIRVMELVKRTTEYYQAGAKDRWPNPLQLFVIVKDFLTTVDQACLDIRQKLQKRNVSVSVGSSPPQSPHPRIVVKFPNLMPNIVSNRTASSNTASPNLICNALSRLGAAGEDLVAQSRCPIHTDEVGGSKPMPDITICEEIHTSSFVALL
ncbi:LOW QUALITY PROTEIN: Formin, FH2 domain [Dillenia turbinata]|uniref:Formin-like protein n=1 Tax=Dillenia turbinata TaxID=194707 RepID=A0AAN8Z2J4_9MAGN